RYGIDTEWKSIVSAAHLPSLYPRHLGLSGDHEHRALHRLVRRDTQTDARLGQREVPNCLTLHGRLHPLHLDTRVGHESQDERTAGDQERMGRAQQVPAGSLGPGVGCDRLHTAAVWAHHHAGGVEQRRHHITSSPPWLIFTSESLTSIWLLPRCK